MTKQEWLVVGIAAAIVIGAYLFITTPWVVHRDPTNLTRTAFSIVKTALDVYALA